MTTIRHIAMAVLAATLLAGCSADSTDETTSLATHDADIHFNVDVWRMMEGTRATTYDNAAALQSEGSFTCAVYLQNTTTEYFTPTAVNWNSTNTEWAFSDGKHYWPATGSLDFFAYMPATKPSYITAGPTYTSDHNVTFTCTSLPNTVAEQDNTLKEFVYAMALDQDKVGTNSSAQPTPGKVALTFQHPFARIKLRWADYDHSGITLNSVTLKSIKQSGSYDKSATPQWTTTGDAVNFTTTTLDDYDSDPLTSYLIIPQSWAGEIEVAISWNNWGETENTTLTATTPTDWVPGHSYTYTFNVSKYALTVDIAKFTEQW